MCKNQGWLKIWGLLLFVVLLGACKSKFERLRASNDMVQKYQVAMQLYQKKEYNRALLLFEELVQRYRGRAEAEEIYYFYAYTHYKLHDYLTARYHFKVFAETYPYSSKAEESRYMAAKCYYLESPPYSLDQQNTVKAVEALQLFINLYPRSERLAEASKLISDLRDKLETKSYANAKLFLDIGDYKSAIIAFRNSLRDYPDTKYAEEIEFLVIKAQYLLAKNSLEAKQEERFRETIQYAIDFLDKYPAGKYAKGVKQLQEEAEKNLALARKKVALAGLNDRP